jgi:oxygen-independent coproporphyrinogen III oxidase
MTSSTGLYRKYGVSAPRLNCFPPARDWSQRGLKGGKAPQVSLAKQDYALYVHLPFCKSRCGFCACNISVARDERYFGEYEQALLQEFDTKLEQWDLAKGQLTQLVIGGGTPTLYAPDALSSLAQHFTAKLGVTHEVEKWIEIDPRVTTAAHFEVLGAAGFRHGIFGIETYEDKVQEIIKKKVSRQLMSEQLHQAKANGFETLLANVLIGLPHQTATGLQYTLDTLLQQEVNAIALYPYMHVPWVRPEKRAFNDEDVLSEEAKVDLFSGASDFLLQQGFVDLGQGSFYHQEHPFVALLLENKLKRNYMGLGPNAAERVVGLGVSAISLLGDTLGQAPKELGHYLQWSSQSELPFARWTQPNEKQNAIARLIRQLWEEGTFHLEPISWSPSEKEVLARGLASLREDGLLESKEAQHRITPLGRQFMHQIVSLFYFPTLNIIQE